MIPSMGSFIMTFRTFGVIAALGIALAGCGKKDQSPGSDNEIDPAVANALEDMVMVDPNLTQQNNRFGARGGEAGMRAPVPPAGGGPEAPRPDGLMRAPAPVTDDGKADAVTLGQVAERRAARSGGKAIAACDRNYRYGAEWANRLPADFPLYADAQVKEAAGNADACALRLVSFVSKAPMQTLVDFYYTQAVRGGYSAEHRVTGSEHVLAGAREKDGAAYYLDFAPMKGGTVEVDMIVNKGR